MKVTVIPIIIVAFGAILKAGKVSGRISNQRKIPDHADKSIIEFNQNTE